jgi:hypothetical protein
MVWLRCGSGTGCWPSILKALDSIPSMADRIDRIDRSTGRQAGSLHLDVTMDSLVRMQGE